MTKKSKQRREGLFAPRRPARWRAFDSDYGRHVLDSAKVELHPSFRHGLLDQPGVPADDPYMSPQKSELFISLNALIDAAAARAGTFNSDLDDPLMVMAELAGLTMAEYEAVAMQADGFDWPAIAKRQRISENAVRLAARRAREKLQKYALERA